MTKELGVWRAEDCALVLIDYQNEMFEVIRSETSADLVELHVRLLAKTAKAYGVPIVLSTVGVGFGLQNVTSNFISGLVVLAERPIKIGDRVELDKVAGQITAIHARSTTVLTNDNIAIVVPNSHFIEKAVTNWTHGDPKVRFRIPIGVAYGSEVEKVRELLLSIAREHPAALKEPEPVVFFDGFGDKSLNFELGVWSAEMSSRRGVSAAI